MDNERKTLGIVGGGAAGLAAAVAAGLELRRLRQAGARGADAVDIVVYEADERVGRSILATGNGRCNFSNARIDAGLYRNGAFVAEALSALQEQRASGEAAPATSAASGTPATPAEHPVCGFFADLGLAWREDGEGRLYPLANKASSVLDVLRAACAALGVREVCGMKAAQIVVPARAGERFHVRFSDGAVEHARALVVACGGGAARPLLPKEYACEPYRPVLGPLRTREGLVKNLDNIRVRARVLLSGPDGREKAAETGEVLFRSYGVSGIAVFNLSRFAEPGDALLLDFLPSVGQDGCEGFLLARRKRMTASGLPLSCEDFLRGLLLPQVAREVLKRARLKPAAALGKADVAPLAAALKGFALTVEGIGDARQCQVTRGGCCVEAFDARTLESRSDRGLHVVGEALDVDAPCGGYNLHWAWASGILAGGAAAAGLCERCGR